MYFCKFRFIRSSVLFFILHSSFYHRTNFRSCNVLPIEVVILKVLVIVYFNFHFIFELEESPKSRFRRKKSALVYVKLLKNCISFLKENVPKINLLNTKSDEYRRL